MGFNSKHLLLFFQVQKYRLSYPKHCELVCSLTVRASHTLRADNIVYFIVQYRSYTLYAK